MILSASPIILRGGQPDHMQTVQSRRMPVFVAKKSQYRNCQQQERVADRHRARRRWRSRNFNIGITIVRVGPEPSQWRDTIIWERFGPWRLAKNKSPGLVLSGRGRPGPIPRHIRKGALAATVLSRDNKQICSLPLGVSMHHVNVRARQNFDRAGRRRAFLKII